MKKLLRKCCNFSMKQASSLLDSWRKTMNEMNACITFIDRKCVVAWHKNCSEWCSQVVYAQIHTATKIFTLCSAVKLRTQTQRYGEWSSCCRRNFGARLIHAHINTNVRLQNIERQMNSRWSQCARTQRLSIQWHSLMKRNWARGNIYRAVIFGFGESWLMNKNNNNWLIGVTNRFTQIDKELQFVTSCTKHRPKNNMLKFLELRFLHFNNPLRKMATTTYRLIANVTRFQIENLDLEMASVNRGHCDSIEVLWNNFNLNQ